MSMKLTQYIKPECFVPALSESTREGAFRSMVHLMVEKGHIRNEDKVFDSLMEREAIQSTAVGDGIAIPHCFTDEVADLVIGLARAPQGIPFDSFDGDPVRVIFLLLGNREGHGLHLKALARIARLIKCTGFIEKVLASPTVEAMVRAFEEEEAKI
jgi:mannitol/fructose-specific phosphotransferase system IIA component (Ntr-type)